MPESGDSRLMYVATKAPARMPVKRAMRAEFDAFSTAVIRRNEMTISATKATAVPLEPGRVAAYRTLSCVMASPQITALNMTPAVPPTNCAST